MMIIFVSTEKKSLKYHWSTKILELVGNYLTLNENIFVTVLLNINITINNFLVNFKCNPNYAHLTNLSFSDILTTFIFSV